jgi:hypothetical protein
VGPVSKTGRRKGSTPNSQEGTKQIETNYGKLEKMRKRETERTNKTTVLLLFEELSFGWSFEVYDQSCHLKSHIILTSSGIDRF